MPVHIDEMVSEVSADAPPATNATDQQTPWQEAARLRQLHELAIRDAWRTAAEGFDD